MARLSLSRRNLLRGMLGGTAVAVGLPFLEVFLDDKKVRAQGLPKRFGIFFWGNGNLPSRFTPTTIGPDWELTDQLAPLESVKSLITVVSGMGVKTGNHVAHSSGAAGIFTGSPLVRVPSDTFAGPSLDQIIAAEIGGETRFRSIETTLRAEDESKAWSLNGPHDINKAEYSPRALYQRIFSAESGFRLPGEDPIIDPTVGLRRSVLDAVMEDSARLRSRLGARDRQRLDRHFEWVRALEQRLQRLEEDPPNLAACMRPDEPDADYPAVNGLLPLSDISRAMVDILTMALACDQTRVFSHWLTTSVSNLRFPNTTVGHHELTHNEPMPQPQVHTVVLQVMAELAYLIERLHEVEEGEGTLLDHCIVLATSDCSLGNTHQLEDFPIILAGNGAGTIVQGTHYHSPSSENTSKAMLSIIRAMGIPAVSFGASTGRATDGLGAIEV